MSLSRGVAPYTAMISLTVSEGAKPGLYPFHVMVHNHTRGQAVGEEELGLLVMPKRLTPRDFVKLRRIYRYEGLGAQGVLWYLIARVYENGVSFMELKRAYELVRGGPVKKATIAKILKQMIRKSLIKKGKDGRYYSLVTRPEIAFSRIDRKRVRIQRPGRTVKKIKESRRMLTIGKLQHEPYIARLAFKRAEKIAQRHDSLAATYFLVYSLVGVRETGTLLLWLNTMFIYCEQKTGFCHYFYSQLLHHYFQLLGLKQGVMYKNSQEHLEAMKIANKHVRKYGSHQTSRRLHYELKKQGYIEYDKRYTTS